jgi:gas vesicle protein
MMENKSKSKIALGIILGVAAGAAVYYFMTSENGKQQLSDVIDSVKDFVDKTKLSTEKHGENLVKRAGEISSDVVSRAKDATSELAKRAIKITSEIENG